MSVDRISRMFFATAAVLFLGVELGAVPSANAGCVGSQPVSTCTAICTANCWLRDEISCADGQGITVNAGYNLDMCGRNITCTAPNGVCLNSTSIKMVGNSSKVFNTLNAPGPYYDESTIAGYFTTGVDCASKSTSEVKGIRFSGPVVGALNCAKVMNNVFASNSTFGEGNYAVFGIGVADSDVFSDNYIQNQKVYYGGNKNIEISHNVLVQTPMHMGMDAGIDISVATGVIDVLSNIFQGSSGTPITDNEGYNSNYSGNICDPANTECEYCKSNGWCQSALTPYAGP